MKTEKLIENLVKDSSSVKPILSTPIVFLFWLLASLSFLILFVWSRSNELNTLHSPEKSYEIIPILISIFFSGY
ncbi:MAG TPA: hypothetical protein PKC66_19790, partial [Leptospiraceae bacterium]|nr:hypothetical protein [Leptospiraceae bacterium]